MALLSLALLALLLLTSLLSRINVGWLAILAGVLLAELSGLGGGAETLKRFPSELFLTLLGICYLFNIVEANGTLETLFHNFKRLLGGHERLLPWGFFAFACTIAAIGAGNIAATALVAPLAMLSGRQGRRGPLLMAVMVGNGANAGALSPLAPAGIILAVKLKEAGLAVEPWTVFGISVGAHFLVSLAGFWLLGGHRLTAEVSETERQRALTPEQRATLGLLFLMITGVVAGYFAIGPAAIAAALVLNLLYPRYEDQQLSHIPWNTLIMVSGLSLFVNVVEASGGVALLSSWLSRSIELQWRPAGLAFLSGLLSSFSSSTAVVLPTFIPLIPGLMEAASGEVALNLTVSVAAGAHLVDLSPLSTIGALCLAAVPDSRARLRLYKQMLAWGLGMVPVGALLCQAFAAL